MRKSNLIKLSDSGKYFDLESITSYYYGEGANDLSYQVLYRTGLGNWVLMKSVQEKRGSESTYFLREKATYRELSEEEARTWKINNGYVTEI